MDVAIQPDVEIPEDTQRARLLTDVLRQSEHVSVLMKQSSEELSSVNSRIRQELAINHAWPAVASALASSAAVESKLQDVSAKLNVLTVALENEVRQRTLVDHQLAAAMEQEESARSASFHDLLTGLPNRALFNDRLEHSLAQARRYRWTLAVMFIDLDKFKEINDTYGHSAGDAVLQTIAKRLKHNTRDDDTVSRRSGDEFLYLLTQIHDPKNIGMIAEKILKAIQVPCESILFGPSGKASVQGSMGIAVYPKNGDTADMLMHRADEAMYRAKQNKSGFQFAR